MSKLKVLLVEDNHLSAMLVNKHLESLGHEVTSADNGRQGLDLLARYPYDVVIMDLQMPVLDGLAATTMLRQGEAGELNRNVPVIALTAHALDEFREQCRAAGMSDFLSKPVELEALAQAIDRILEGTQTELPEAVQAEEPVQQGRDVDIETARKRLGIDMELFMTVLGAAMDEISVLLDKCRDALDHNDVNTVAVLAHTMKSTSASMGADKLNQLSISLQQAAKQGDLDQTRQLLDEVILAFARVQEVVGDDQ
ncbi:MAG: response regulator [Desulfovibrio sp.]|nr:MAG: response regulator [Desulfovibrio sp.]